MAKKISLWESAGVRFPRATHLPLYRQEDVLFRQGVNLPRSTLCRWVIEAAQLLKPFYDLLKSQVLASKVIHTDDTPVKVLDRLLSQTRRVRAWLLSEIDELLREIAPSSLPTLRSSRGGTDDRGVADCRWCSGNLECMGQI